MSQENVEIVRRVIDYFGETGEIPSDYYAPEVVFAMRPDGPSRGVFHGIEGLRRAVAEFRDAWAESAFEAETFIEGNDTVVVPLLFRLRSQSGVELEVEEFWAYWLRDGKICRVEQHGTKQDALKAVGLAELGDGEGEVTHDE
jgi:ketosteroid isomerase-like protein